MGASVPSGDDLRLREAQVVHGSLFGVRGEETPRFVRRDLEEVAVAGGVEGCDLITTVHRPPGALPGPAPE